MRTQPPLYRKVGGLHFVRLGRVQLSFCLCRNTAATRKVTRVEREESLLAYRRFCEYTAAQRTIDKGIARIVQREFPCLS